MDTTKVKRAELLAKIKTNRDSHNGIFLKAQEEYRKDVITELERRLEDAKAGKPIERGTKLPEPVDHTADYDRVIGMLEMSVDEVVEIDASEFDRYVLDNWHWKDKVVASNMYYTNKMAK